jgi:DHA1 family multidrug resistance protein-like MFS transporter
MGIQWASTLLGCVAVCLVPIPVAFYFFGKRMRMKSKFAPFFEPASESHAVDMENDETEVDERA